MKACVRNNTASLVFFSKALFGNETTKAPLNTKLLGRVSFNETLGLVEFHEATHERRTVEKENKAKCNHNWELDLTATCGKLRCSVERNLPGQKLTRTALG